MKLLLLASLLAITSFAQTVCTLPQSQTGYELSESSSITSTCTSTSCDSPTFNAVSCASGYDGTVTTSKCSASNAEVTLTGCVPGLCTKQGVTLNSVTQIICVNTPQVCQVYMKKTPLNPPDGVDLTNGNEYCNAFGMTCAAMFEDLNDCTIRQKDGGNWQYPDCEGDDHATRSSDHIIRCVASPTKSPTMTPTANPTGNPTANPSLHPSVHPTANPSQNPTKNPTKNPSKNPTKNPTKNPSTNPTAIPTMAPTSPSFHPTLMPTKNPVETLPNHVSASSHGDPIIHTFKGDCYDLNKDGLYLASSHPSWGHNVKVAVYNNFIREIQITDKNDEIFWSVSNLNEVTGSWKHGLTFKHRMCNQFSWAECEFDHVEYTFDAQVFNYKAQILFHTYLDDALEEGGRGIHLDIYPTIYHKRRKNFKPSEYDGIYFDNPYPEELAYCPTDAHQRV